MRFIGIGLILCALVAQVPVVEAQDRALHWERYDIAVSLGADGNLRVVETQHLVIDQGSFRTGSRSFTTGSFGRVRSVSVSEDGQAYTRGAEQPGTFSASDDGERFQLTYVFRDPEAAEHTMTIAYTVAQPLIANGDEALLEWNFFCAESTCPRIDSGSLTFQPPSGISATNLETTTAGAAVTAAQTGNQWRWELDGPVQGEQVTLQARFPRAALAPSVVFRDENAPQPAEPRTEPSFPEQPGLGTSREPGLGIPGQPAPVGTFSPTFCVVGLFILIALFSMMGRSVRRRGGMGGPRTPGLPVPGLGIPFPPMVQRRRRFGGGLGRGFGRGFGRGYGGWGVPPIIPPIIPPLPPSYGDQNPWGGSPRPDRSTDGDSSGGGGFSWGDSGGGVSSWSDSSGGGSSWGDSGGGGSSWSDSGGGGSSGRSGGGSNDSSSFN